MHLPRSLAPPSPVLPDDLFAVLLDDASASSASDGFDLVRQSSPGVGRDSWARALATPLVLALAGCSAYGWADRPGPTRVDRPVLVRTVDVDAHAGADPAALTRELVTELQHAGIAGAAWSGAQQERDIVECDVAVIEDLGFGEHASVAVSTRCRVDGEVVGVRDADAQLALRSGDRNVGRRRAAETAARMSLAAVAEDVARHLAGVR